MQDLRQYRINILKKEEYSFWQISIIFFHFSAETAKQNVKIQRIFIGSGIYVFSSYVLELTDKKGFSFLIPEREIMESHLPGTKKLNRRLSSTFAGQEIFKPQFLPK